MHSVSYIKSYIMTKIVTTTDLQQHIGAISASIQDSVYIVTRRGTGNIVLLPYFDGCDENISEYLEDYEMARNRKTLQKKYAKSSSSLKSGLVI